MEQMRITSTSNVKIKNLSKCLKSAKERRKQDVFIVEGIRSFVEIPQSQLLETYVTDEFLNHHGEVLDDISYCIVTEHIMDTITDTQTPQGVVALVKRRHCTMEEVCQTFADSEAPLIIALENLQDPGNLGTILRTAEGAGVTGILMSQDTVDVYNPKVVRATMGAIFRIPFLYVEDLTKTVESLQEKGYCGYSAHLQGNTFYDYDYRNSTIFCIGNEGNGLSQELSEVTTHKIKIPMKGQVESLNAATATTVLMYEAMRQRSL